MNAAQRTKLRKAYSRIIARCTNASSRDYRWYGARGIRVCARWLESFRLRQITRGRQGSLSGTAGAKPSPHGRKRLEYFAKHSSRDWPKGSAFKTPLRCLQVQAFATIEDPNEQSLPLKGSKPYRRQQVDGKPQPNARRLTYWLAHGGRGDE